MLRESQLISIAFWLGQGQEVLVVCSDKERKKQILEQTKHLHGSNNLKIKTIDYSNTFQGKVNPGYLFFEESAPASQETLSKL